MKVIPYDGLTRFLVQSDVNPDREFLVDLDAYWGIGMCACEYFHYRLGSQLNKPGMKAIALKNPAAYRCKHILAARQTLGTELVDTLTRKNNQQTKALKH